MDRVLAKLRAEQVAKEATRTELERLFARAVDLLAQEIDSQDYEGSEANLFLTTL